MQIFREDWWATPIWYFDILPEIVNPTNVEKECYLLKDKSEGRVLSNMNGWQSEDIYRDINIPNISKLIDEIEIQSGNIFKDHGLKNIIHVGIDNSWANINFKGSSNNVHTHAGSVMSGVYYVKASENSGDTVFYNDPRLDFYNQLYFDAYNKNTLAHIMYKPVVGRVLIFPSLIPHSVTLNKSQEDRISISFNFGASKKEPEKK
jgi:uncharacterized protein (TIGR02466 family)